MHWVSNGVGKRSTIGFRRPSTAQIGPNHESDCIRRDDDSDQQAAVLAVCRRRSRDKRSASDLSLFLDHDHPHRNFHAGELKQEHNIETAEFLVDGAKHLQTALQRSELPQSASDPRPFTLPEGGWIDLNSCCYAALDSVPQTELFERGECSS